MRFYYVNPACIFSYFFLRLLNTTEKYFNDSKDDDFLRNAEPETFDGSIKLQIVIFIVNGFLYVAVVTGLVAIYLYKRKKYKKGKQLVFCNSFHNNFFRDGKKNKIKMLQPCIHVKTEIKGKIIKMNLRKESCHRMNDHL